MNAAQPPADARAAVLARIEREELAPPAALDRARQVALRTRQPVEQVLNGLGVLSDEALAGLYADACRCAVWEPEAMPPGLDPEAFGVGADYLRRARLLPIDQVDGALRVAACDPLDREALAGLEFATGRSVEVLVCRPGDWRKAFDRVFDRTGATPVDRRRLDRDLDQVFDGSGEGAGARLVASVFEAAVAAGASDIHFEPRRHDLRIRLRIDGRLVDHRTAPADLAAPAVSRIKVVANLNLGERRLPQDGRASFVSGGRSVDVRVATAPTVFGEGAVLRILDRKAVALDLDALGLAPGVSAVLKRAAAAPHGLFLVTGPTGSGKTTTLYALLAAFAGSPRKVMSVEDPVEYHFEHVVQTQVQPAIGLTFASALRSFLRQDPDVILVGEIRDPETAAVAMQAAMTGHLVLASVHANDALAALPRLRDLGVLPYQLAAAFRGAAAQRLVRRLCACSTPAVAGPAEAAFLNAHGLTAPSGLHMPAGCPACGGSGFRGRIPIAEAFHASEALLAPIAVAAPQAEVVQAARTSGFASMLHDGVAKAAAGATTLAEVMAVLDG